MGHHETKTALARALASLVAPNPAGPVVSARVGRPDLFSDLHKALCVFPVGSEGAGADETLLPSSFLFGVAGVHPNAPTELGMGSTAMNGQAEGAASLALSAWMDGLVRDPRLSTALDRLGIDLGRPVRAVRILSERSGDADDFGNDYQDAGGRKIWIDGAEVRVDLL